MEDKPKLKVAKPWWTVTTKGSNPVKIFKAPQKICIIKTKNKRKLILFILLKFSPFNFKAITKVSIRKREVTMDQALCRNSTKIGKEVISWQRGQSGQANPAPIELV